ncbi:signal peptide-containing telomeric insulinase-like protease [Cryptosporidium parvum]|uniref:Insulinase-like protease n=3 Tax=Cryptosporidium parvum TaxID=5807 RepID=A0A5J6ED14_CRYPV|nr:insulinase-like protease [Cryptosporidium parvum]QEU56355.1 insulinase-like protease [Cryptosporidium parvum]
MTNISIIYTFILLFNLLNLHSKHCIFSLTNKTASIQDYLSHEKYIKEVIDNNQFLKHNYTENKYRFIKLNNELDVFLISRPGKHTYGTLHIQVGSHNDPEYIPGLAHLLKQSLFINTKKYPEIYGFYKFIHLHFGETSAFTDLEYTRYYFKINSNVIEEALDRFSQSFIDPLFDEHFIEKEIININHENDIYKKQEYFNLSIIRKLTNNNNNNNETFKLEPILKEIDIRNEIIRFYQNEYSSNKMILVLTSNKSIDELTNLAIKYFSKIQNKQLPLKSFDEEIIFNHTNPYEYLKKKIIFAESIHKKNLITLYLPFETKLNGNEKLIIIYIIMKYINHNLNSNKFQYLNKKLLINDIKCHFYTQEIQFNLFKIYIELTINGIKNIEYILKEIYSAIIYIKENISFEQILQDYNHSQNEQYYNYVDDSPNNQIIDKYFNYKLMPKYVIINNIETNQINENTINSILSEIEPENMLILINTNKFNKLFDHFENNNKIVQKYKSLINTEFNIKYVKIENYTKIKYYITNTNESLIKLIKKNQIENFKNYFNITSNTTNLIHPDYSNQVSNITKLNTPIRLLRAMEFINSTETNQCIKLFNEEYYDYLDQFYYFPIDIKSVMIRISIIFPYSTLNDDFHFFSLKKSQVIYLYTKIIQILIKKQYNLVKSNDISRFTIDLNFFSIDTLAPLSLTIGIDSNSYNIADYELNKISKILNNLISTDEESFNDAIKEIKYEIISSQNNQIENIYISLYNQLFYNQDQSNSKLLKSINELSYVDFIELVIFYFKKFNLKGVFVGNIHPINATRTLEHFLSDFLPEKEQESIFTYIWNIIKAIFTRRRWSSNSKSYSMYAKVISRIFDLDLLPDPLISEKYIQNDDDKLKNIQILDPLSLNNRSKFFIFMQRNSSFETINGVYLDVFIGNNSIKNQVNSQVLQSIICSQLDEVFYNENNIAYKVNFEINTHAESVVARINIQSREHIQILSENILQFWKSYFHPNSTYITPEIFEKSKKSVEAIYINFEFIKDIAYDFNYKILKKNISGHFNSWLSIDSSFNKFMEWFEQIYFNSVLFLYAIQTNHHENQLDQIQNYLPFNFTRLDHTKKSLFEIEEIKTYNQLKFMKDK